MTTETALNSYMDAILANCRQYWLNYSNVHCSNEHITSYQTGVPHPQLNGVIRMREAAAVEKIPLIVSQLSGRPSVWWIGPDSYPAASDDLVDAGARLIGKVPVMAVQLEDLRPPAKLAGNVSIERLEGGEELGSWVQCYSEPMGVAAEDFAVMLHAEQNRSDASGQLTRFAARSEGEIVGTSELFVHDNVAGVYLVTTKNSHRRLGIGTALTQAAAVAGLELGLKIGTLQASSSGYPVCTKKWDLMT
ncbi:GNAT family N-acetyltransferase [Sinorhizobium numidicum]|uniref:GNAT family N-acetyltransferase n=1 Tax=Sinorhizobium numidicum TaxID=680248 RepID=A0ABY8CQD1_9HYPH|nr:GNAT family N-acetyltransferase [Sinorhizobium numidicum]WEX74863.1 GNAT family N-acetyltransferase [Sinorhizobium numidicum]WEX80856.1 GNAT family N-acetyltransferase [Sinorhizobium numidicum]